MMSLREKGPREPRQKILQQIAARIIQKTWRRHVNRAVFRHFKEFISHCNKRDPKAILKSVNPREAELLDAAAGVFIRFRLGGITFPPNIYYKIFTHRPITDLCANSPKDYTQPGLKKPVAQQEDRSGWYQRMENNSWRLFCSKVVSMSEPKEIDANEKLEFHHSRLQRQQDVSKWRQKRKIEWLKKMYNQGRLQTHPVHRHTAATTPVVNSRQEAMDAIEEKGHDEILDRELEELTAWTNTLNFEEYMLEWRCLACSHSSEPNNDVHSYPPRLEPHEFAAVAERQYGGTLLELEDGTQTRGVIMSGSKELQM